MVSNFGEQRQIENDRVPVERDGDASLLGRKGVGATRVDGGGGGSGRVRRRGDRDVIERQAGSLCGAGDHRRRVVCAEQKRSGRDGARRRRRRRRRFASECRRRRIAGQVGGVKVVRSLQQALRRNDADLLQSDGGGSGGSRREIGRRSVLLEMVHTQRGCMFEVSLANGAKQALRERRSSSEKVERSVAKVRVGKVLVVKRRTCNIARGIL
jgi:hypothetical protein